MNKLNEIANGLNDLSQYAGEKIYEVAGCDKCNNGYKGRMVFYEILEPNENIKKAIINNSSSDKLMEVCIENGVSPLASSGLKKVLEGKTTIEEVIKALDS